MSAFEILSSSAAVTALFAGDQPIARGPFLPEIGRPFAEEFQFGSLGLVPTVAGAQAGMWQAENGQFKEGTHVALIENCRGSLTELSATVAEVDTRTAEKALREIWGTLGRLYRQNHSDAERAVNLDQLGTFAFESSATVKGNKSFAELFPLAEKIRAEVANNVEAPVKTFEEPMFRMGIDMPLLLGRRLVSRRVVFEPRYYVQDKDKVFFARAPIRSEQLEQVLRKIFGG